MSINDVEDRLPDGEEHHKTVAESIVDSVEGKDEPIGERDSLVPYAMVQWTYPIVLIVLILGALAYFWMQG